MTKIKKIKKNLVSVIINCYNGEKYLNKAIDSVLNQTHKDLEIIFWDNKSKDKSKLIVMNYKDRRIKYFYAKKFTNLHMARNLAIKKACGEFISFLDVDDYWSKNKLELQLKKFKNSKVNFVYGNCWLIKENYIFKKKIFSKNLLPNGNILNDLLKIYSIPLPTIIIRKKILNNMRHIFNPKLKVIGDFDLSLRLSINNNFDCIQEPIAFNRIHSESFSYKNKLVELKELSSWFTAAKKGKFGKKLSINPNLKYLNKKIEYLKILYSKKLNNSLLNSLSFLISNFNKENLKIFLKINLPKIIIKKFTIYG